jgi:hypothetical protein
VPSSSLSLFVLRAERPGDEWVVAGVDDERRKGSVVALNNLCVDIMVEMDVLPGAGAAAKRATLLQLQGSPPPDTSAWEVGGASNFAIAAARLGVDCTCLGHLGRDSYGTCASSPAARSAFVCSNSKRACARRLVWRHPLTPSITCDHPSFMGPAYLATPRHALALQNAHH